MPPGSERAIWLAIDVFNPADQRLLQAAFSLLYRSCWSQAWVRATPKFYPSGT